MKGTLIEVRVILETHQIVVTTKYAQIFRDIAWNGWEPRISYKWMEDSVAAQVSTILITKPAR
jgi:hypothetical protein